MLEIATELTEGQRRTIERAYEDCEDHVRVVGAGNGWVETIFIGPAGEVRGDVGGHLFDEDGDYRFPGGGKVSYEDMA